MSAYFNFQATVAADRWQRRRFLNLWWRFYGRDPYWSPPYFPLLRDMLAPGSNAYLERAQIQQHFLEAMRRRRRATNAGVAAIGEIPVAAAVTVHQTAGANLLALLRCANDASTLGYLLEHVATEIPGTRWLGPTHLSPYLGAGTLTSHWSEPAPSYTPYNPPYLPELLDTMMEPVSDAHLYYLLLGEGETSVAAPGDIRPLKPARLGSDMLPLFQAACAPWQPFSPPTAAEAQFVVSWLATWPLRGWLALVDGDAVGFVLVQDDLGPALWRAGGGRAWSRRLWLRWRAGRPAARGRLLFGAVDSRWRRQGIGARLLATVLNFGRERGWQAVVAGPIPESADAASFFTNFGGKPRQSYRLYSWTGPTAGWF